MFKPNKTFSSDLFQKWERVYCQVLNELANAFQEEEEINVTIYDYLSIVNIQLFDFANLCKNNKITNRSISSLKNNLGKLIALFSKNEHIKELLEPLLVELAKAFSHVNSLTMNSDSGDSLLNSYLTPDILLKEVVPFLSLQNTLRLSSTCKFFSKYLKEDIEVKRPRLATGKSHTLIYINHSLYSFGKNSCGQLGLGYVGGDQNILMPVKLPGDKRVELIACGAMHSIVLCDNGSAYSFGLNYRGQLGLGQTQRHQAIPWQVKLPSEKKATFAACGLEHSIIVCDDGSAYSFGLNDRGQLGSGDRHKQVALPQKVKLPPGKGGSSAACGREHSIIVCDDGSAYSFGSNDYGQLGSGDTHKQSLPQRVKLPLGRRVTFTACGFEHTIIVCDDGSAYGFGSNDYGQLGSGDTHKQSLPQRVKLPLGRRATFAACGKEHSMVLCEDGSLYGFGRNQFGQLMREQKEINETPQLIDSKVQSITCGESHSLLYKDGQVYIYGRNTENLALQCTKILKY
jgi:alpha-tubulin suppressor-like RCC1 family protein